MICTRTLKPGDEGTVASFLAGHADSSMFLRANLRAGGLVDRGETFQATWAGAFAEGALVGVAAHAWNGNLLVQAPRALTEVVRAAAAASPRPVAGLLGERAQVIAARDALGLSRRPASFDSHDDLFALDLGRLVVPEPLAAGRVCCMRATSAEREVLVGWRCAYRIELLGDRPDDPGLRAASATEVDTWLADEGAFVLVEDGAPVACAAFNARLPDCVQIGGVFTVPGRRGRGHGRAAVAGALLRARDLGVWRTILFTGRDNEPARRAYRALGYEVVGDFGIVFFVRP